MKLLNKHNMAVRFAASKEESRYTLRAILATENETVATDGHIMCRVSLPNTDAKNFPLVDGFTPNGFTRGLIPLDAAKDIENAIPKSKNLPILNHAAISSERIGETDRELLKIATTDLDTPKLLTVRQPDGTFPNWQQVWPKDKKPVIDLCLNARLLAAIAQAATKFSDRAAAPIRLRFYGEHTAMRFDLVNDDGQEMNGLLMPLRADVNPTFMEPAPAPEPAEEAEAQAA
jgi:hypothetical protein